MSEKTIRILLIEDNLRDARLIREILASVNQTDLGIPGFDVARTAKLSTGLKRLRKEDIDVILLDLSLPDSQGLDTFIKVHTQAPEVPVVTLSEPEDKALAIEAVHEGAQDYLIKGQTSSALLIRSIHYAVKYARIETARQQTEETLRASEQRFRLLYENTPLAYHSLDKDGCLIEVNQAWLDMLGYSRDHVIGRWFGDFLSPQHVGDFKQNLPRFIASGTTQAEFEMVRQDESLIVVSMDGRIGHDEQGNFKQTHCILHDVTERKRAEKALQESEERHRIVSKLTSDIQVYTTFEDITDRKRAEEALRKSEANLRQAQHIAHLGSWELNLEKNTFTVSEEMIRIYEYEDRYTGPVSMEEFASYIHPDDRETVLSALNAAIAGAAPYDLEFRIVRTDGKVRILHAQGEVTRDESGKPIRMIGTGLDITDRKQMEETLHYRVQFEGLITDISTHFVNLASDEVDKGINRALRLIGDFTDVDRSYVLLFRDDGAMMDNTHEWCAEGIEPQIQRLKGVPTDAFRWSLERIRRSEAVHIPRVADLPPEASAEKEEFQTEGIQSLIMVPIVYGRNALGFLGLDSVRVEKEWAEDTIVLLRIVGETFANALERKKSEAALRESEERYRQLFELESDALFLVDNESGRILEANAAASALYRYSHEELLTKRNTDLSAEPEDTKKVTQTTPSADQIVTVPLRFHRKKDGTVFPVEITGRFFDRQGRSVHIAAIRDITDRKRAEAQIEKLNHLQGDLLSPRSLAEKLGLITESVVSIFDADFARIWIIQPGDLCESGCIHAQVTECPHVCRYRERCLHLLSSSGRYTHIDGEIHRRVPFGCYKIGRVAAGEDPKFITNDVVHDPRVHDRNWAKELGLTSFAGYRLKSISGEILGVLALFSKHTISSNEDALLEGLANTTAQVIQTTQAEEALERSEATLRSIFRAAPVGILLVSQRVLLWVNDRICEMLGYSSDELIGKSARVLYSTDEDYEYAGREKSAQIEERGTSTVETRWRHKDGKVFDILLGSTPIDPSAPSKGITFTALDITERKQAGEALRESEERYRELANSITDVFFAMDNDLRYTYWNTASEQLTGLAAKDALGKSIQEIFPDNEDTKRMVQAYREILGTQKPQAFVTDYHIAGADFFEISAYPSKDGISVFAKDITERKQAEEERERLLARIQEQARRVQQIMDTVPEGVILLDANARIVLANPLGRKDLNVLADTLVGGTLTRLGDRPLTEILTSPPRGLWHEIAAEGRNFQVIARPVSEATEAGPAPGGWVLVIRDVTQQRESERRIQQQERLAAVGQLAAGIAHDFNNIMAVITLYAGMSLRTPDVPENVYERLEIINQQAQHASDLIQQIMDFSRRAVLERGPMDLLAFMKEQVKLLQRTLPESIKIDLSHGKDEYTIRADLTRIQQVVMNLATNARDAMPQGGKLHITLERILVEESDTPPVPEMEAGEWVCVRVTDTGSGIPNDVLPHIFNPFFTTKEPGKGTGLGLAQVYGIIRQHEGHVDVRTQTGKGTTFILYLPALSVEQPETPTAKTEQLPQGQGQTILVVEDEATTRAAVVGSLELLGYQVLKAANGQEALSIFEQYADQADQLDRIALVLSDVVMPEMGGQALFYALKQQDPDIKVLLLTGHPLEEEGLEALRAQGLANWLPKPPSLEQLAKVIAQVLGKENEEEEE